MRRALVLVVPALLGACHVLMLADVPCDVGRDDQCPPGLACGADGICGEAPVDGGEIVDDDAGLPDGDAGAPPPDAGDPGDGGPIVDGGGACLDDFAPPPVGVLEQNHVGLRDGAEGPYDRVVAISAAATDGRPTADVVAIDIGDELSPTLSEHATSAFGSIVAWVRVGVDLDAITGESALFHVEPWTVSIAPGPVLVVDNGVVRFESSDLAEELADGEEHLFSLRYDARRPLDATAHVILHVDAIYEGGVFAPWQPTPLVGPHLLGASPSCASGVTSSISGLTVYRRVLTDGRSGTDIGDVNELATMRESSDPLTTGVFDVLLSVPTDNQDTRRMRDEDQAWAMPLDDELANLDGFALSEVLTDPGQRFVLGDGVTVESMPDDERVFDDGVAFRSSSPVEGIGMWIPVTPGDSLVARVIAHGEGDVEPHLFFVSPGFVIESAGPRGHATSSREAPDELVSTVEIPAGVAEVYVEVRDANATGDRVFVHQIEAYKNLVVNPSAETGATDVGCACFVPTGWSPGQGLTGGGSQLESSAHSGSSAVRISGTFTDFPSLSIDMPDDEMWDDDHYAIGAFFRWNSGQSPRVYTSNGSFFPHMFRPGSRGNAKIDIRPRLGANGSLWVRVESIGRRILNGQWNNHFDYLQVGGQWNAVTDHALDDVYVVRMKNVDTELTPGPTYVDDRVHVNGADETTIALSSTPLTATVTFDLAWGNGLSGVDDCDTGYESLFTLTSPSDDQVFLAGRGDGDLYLRLQSDNGFAEHTLPGALPSSGQVVTYAIAWTPTTVRVDLDGVTAFDVPFAPDAGLDLFFPGRQRDFQRPCDVVTTIPVVE